MVVLKNFPLEVMQIASFQPKFCPKYTDHGEKKVLIIKFSSILTKTSENCFYIVNFYFRCTFHCFWAGSPILQSIFLKIVNDLEGSLSLSSGDSNTSMILSVRPSRSTL